MAESEDLAAGVAGRAGPAALDAAIGLALGRGGQGGVDAEAAAFLRDQRLLVNLQIEALEQDQGLQRRHLALRFFGDRLRIGLQLLAIAFGGLIVAGLVAMIWQAHNDRGLVVDAFSVPPTLAQDGLTGELVAARFLDKLQGPQSSTDSARAGHWRDALGRYDEALPHAPAWPALRQARAVAASRAG